MLAGCTSQEHYGASQPHNFSKADFWVGDFVSITTSDGQKLELEITEVSETGISGKDVEFSYEDLRDLKVKVTHDRTKEEVATAVVMAPVEIVGGVMVSMLAWFVGAGIAALLMAL